VMRRWIPELVLGRDVQGDCPVDGKGDNAGLVMVAIRQARKGPCRAEELRLVEGGKSDIPCCVISKSDIPSPPAALSWPISQWEL
jgi:hypothetical protein